MNQNLSSPQNLEISSSKIYSNKQLVALVILRMMIGWHLLYEGISKLNDPFWTAAGYLSQTEGFLQTFSLWILSNEEILRIVDLLNQWGLIILGICLILGLFSRLSAIMATVLLIFYYLCAPEMGSGENLYINKLLIEAMALLVIYVFPTGHLVGLDLFLDYFKKKNNG